MQLQGLFTKRVSSTKHLVLNFFNLFSTFSFCWVKLFTVQIVSHMNDRRTCPMLPFLGSTFCQTYGSKSFVANSIASGNHGIQHVHIYAFLWIVLTKFHDLAGASEIFEV